MQQNYYLSKPILSAKGPGPTVKKLSSPTSIDFIKSPIPSEPDYYTSKDDKIELKAQKKFQSITEEDEPPKSSKILMNKPKSISINSTPRAIGLKGLHMSPHVSAESSKLTYFNEGVQVSDPPVKAGRKMLQSDAPSLFENFMKRFNLVKAYSMLPNPEPVKHSEKAYGFIKGFGICTNQGLVRDYNEDRVSIILNVIKPGTNTSEQQVAPCSIFALFDGHGGAKCADFLRNNLHNYIVKSRHFPWDLQEALREAFEETEKAFTEAALASTPGNHEKSGSCALVMVLIEDTCYICNLGDSRAIMSQNSGASVYALTRDHKPSDKQEQKRIIAAGGKVYQNPNNLGEQSLGLDMDIALQKMELPFRILPGKLSVSRAFGDIEAKLPQFGGNPNVLIAKPEITKLKISHNHDFILLGCDGIFDHLSNEEVVASVWDCMNKKETPTFHKMMGMIAENTAKAALLSRSFDNVTAIIVAFENLEIAFNNKKSISQRNNSKPDVGLYLPSRNTIRQPVLNSPVNGLNVLAKNSQKGLLGLSGADQISQKKDVQLKDLPINWSNNSERRDEIKVETLPKGYLPNIKLKQSQPLSRNDLK